jgi:hypothetical protein
MRHMVSRKPGSSFVVWIYIIVLNCQECDEVTVLGHKELAMVERVLYLPRWL